MTALISEIGEGIDYETKNGGHLSLVYDND